MNTHLVAIGAAVAPGSVGVVVLDGAGWRGSRDLAPRARLVLLELPFYSPELNLMETVFQHPRAHHLADRVFGLLLAEACRKAWDRFAAMPDRIASIIRRERTTIPAQAHTNHNR